MFRLKPSSIVALLFPVFIVCSAIPSCTSCGLKQGGGRPETGRLADDTYKRLRDSIFTNPGYVLAEIDSLQHDIADDSADYYKLELLRADVLCNGDNSGDKGVDAYENVHGYCLRNGDKELEMYYWNYYGNYVLFNLGIRDSARRCYERAYKLMEETGNRSGFTGLCINLADAYRAIGRSARASFYYRRALSWLDSVGSTENLFNVYVGLGQTYAEIANYDEAEGYFKLAGTMLDSVEVYDKFFYHNSYGNQLYFAHRYNDALRQFESAAAYASELRHPSARCIAATNMCEVNLMLGNIKEAHKYLDLAMSWLRQLPNDALSRFYIYSLAGDIALNENDLGRASRYFIEAGDTSIIGPREMSLHYSRLQRLHAQLHNYAAAYHYLKRANHYEKLINNDRIRNQIAEIELRYRQDTTIMQQRLVISEKETEVRTLEVQIFLIVLMAMLIISSIVIYTTYKRRRRVMAEMNLRQSLYAMRLANIRNRISPHFVFNVLNRELKNDNPGIENLVKLLRTNLQLCDRYTVSLQEELEFVDTYVTAEAPSLGNDFVYTKHIAPEVEPSKVIIPSMMVQIFVENAIKHGLRGFNGEKCLGIAVERRGDATVIIVENEGNPSPRTDASGSTGTGMKVVTQTVNLLNERNASKMDIDMKCKPGANGKSAIFTVTITIPDNFDFSPMKN